MEGKLLSPQDQDKTKKELTIIESYFNSFNNKMNRLHELLAKSETMREDIHGCLSRINNEYSPSELVPELPAQGPVSDDTLATALSLGLVRIDDVINRIDRLNNALAEEYKNISQFI